MVSKFGTVRVLSGLTGCPDYHLQESVRPEDLHHKALSIRLGLGGFDQASP